MKRERIPVILFVLIFSLGMIAATIAAAGSAKEANSSTAAALPPGPPSQRYLFSVAPDESFIRQVDPLTAKSIVTHVLLSGGQLISGVNGLATHPKTGELYGVAKIPGQSSRVLATINPFSGEVDPIGSLGNERFAALAFDSAGTLYGTTGDGINNPGLGITETLFIIDTTDASTSFLFKFTAAISSDGESLAFNPDDGLLYRGSGHKGDAVIFMSIDPTKFVTTSIPITGSLQDEEAMALTWWDDQGKFLWVQDHDYPSTLFTVTSDGDHIKVGEMDHVSKGLAWVYVSGLPKSGLYGSSVTGTLFHIDLDTGAGTPVGQMNPGPFFLGGSTEIEYDNITGRAYNQAPNGALFATEFDIRSGMPVTGPIPNGAAHTGMEYVGDILYTTAVTGSFGPSQLYMLDPSTGMTTAIGLTGVGPISGLAYDEENDIMYGVSGGGPMTPTLGTLYTIDLSSGVAVTVGKTVTKAGSLQFGPDGELYAGTGVVVGGFLYRIDPTNGAFSLVGDTGMGSVHGLTLVESKDLYLPLLLKQ